MRQDLQSCRTGEAKLTKGYNLAARYVIHTVGPRYNTKYKTAAESALFMCYRNVLQLSSEHKLSTLGLAVINTTRRGWVLRNGEYFGPRGWRAFPRFPYCGILARISGDKPSPVACQSGETWSILQNQGLKNVGIIYIRNWLSSGTSFPCQRVI